MDVIITLIKKSGIGEVTEELHAVGGLFHGMNTVYIEDEDSVKVYALDRLSEIMFGAETHINIIRTNGDYDMDCHGITNIVYWGSNNSNVYFIYEDGAVFTLPYMSIARIDILDSSPVID